MKRVLSFLLFVIAGLFAVNAADASSIAAGKLADNCDDIPNANTVVINQAMLKLASFPDKASGPINFDAIPDKIDNIQIISADETAPSRAIKAKVKEYLGGTPRFERVMKMKEDDEQVLMYMRPLSSSRNEFIIVIEESTDITVIALTGRISLEELAQYTDFD